MSVKKNINAGLYIRVSTERQAQEGYSIAAQKSNLTNFAKQQKWNIFDIYADEGISGKNIQDRPDVKRLINDIRQNYVNVVVLYKFDRLTRDMSDTEDIIKLIQECGIEVYTISGGIIDVATATGRFMVRINGAVAQLEREQTIERVKTAFIQKVKEGKSLCSSIISYGYNRPKHQEIQTINEKEAIIVKRIFKMYIEGKNFTEIANTLNAEGIPTKKKGKIQRKRYTNELYIINSIWQSKTIRLILSNITYIGGVRYGINKKNGFEEINGLHKPIISEKIWKDTQERLSKIKNVSRTKHSKDNVYYCGTLVCGICKEKLTTQQTMKIKSNNEVIAYHSYRCLNREKKKCTCIAMSHKKVEKAFIKYLNNIENLSETEKIKLSIYEDENLNNIEQLKKREIELNKKRKESMNLFINNIIDHEQMSYIVKELDEKINIVSKEITNLKEEKVEKKEKLPNMLDSKILNHWHYLNTKEKLEFLNLFVKNIIIINRDKNRVNGNVEIIKVNFYDY